MTTSILVVDDSAFMRKMIVQMIESNPSFKIVGIARNGQDAIEQAQRLKPDIITLDIEMPIMDGLSALLKLKSDSRTKSAHVLMCSSLTVAASNEALKALRIGASDIIAKDPAVVGTGDAGFKRELLSKLRALSSSTYRGPSSSSSKASLVRAKSHRASSSEFTLQADSIDAVVIGASTGGPPVLETILSQIESTLPVPIIVAQHMPALFTRSLAERFDSICACGAQLAESGTMLDKPGIYVAPGGLHTRITRLAGRRIVTKTLEEHPGAIYKPSVDLLFESAAETFDSRVLAIQLTGMGEDGKLGAAKIVEAGGNVITQNAESCVVYGMPKAVVESGSSAAALTPDQIQKLLTNLSRPNAISQQSIQNNSPKRRSA